MTGGGGGVRQYPDCVRLFHTSTPLRSVELSKEWQRVCDKGKSVTLSLLCQTFPHFHTSEKCRPKERMRERSWLGKKGDIILTFSDLSTLLHLWEVWNLGWERQVWLFHTSTPQRSVELRMKKESRDPVASAGHLCRGACTWNLPSNTK